MSQELGNKSLPRVRQEVAAPDRPATEPARASSGQPGMNEASRITRLCALLQDGLRRAVRAGAATDAEARASEDHALRASLREASRIAREDGIRAEQLLMLIKGEWPCMPEASRLSWTEMDATLAHVITLCIVEYYRRGAADDQPAPSAISSRS